MADLSPSSIHVLVVANHWSVKGDRSYAGVFVDRQVDSLLQTGIQVSTFDLGTSHSPVHLFKRWLALRQAVQQLGIDLVHARSGTIVAILSVFAGKPAIVTYIGSDLLPGASVSFLRTYVGIFLSNLAVLFARKVICVSEQLRQALWWEKHKAVVIPDGVDLDLFVPGDQFQACQQLGWEADKPIAIMNAARDPANKGLDIAQRAIAMVQKSIPNAELIIVEGISPDQMPLCYQAADVLVCASRQEGSPNVVKEALACNCPVVSTPVGDVPERLAGVQPSAIVPRDPIAIAAALEHILAHKKRCNGRSFILDLSLQKIAGHIVSIYCAAIN